jgi:ABC-type antimicrobial peptide transport system permease subunit
MELQLSMNFASDGMLWVFIIGVTTVVSLLSGLYPSLVVSGFRPAQALKNQINTRSASGFNLRRSLVVLQFVISQFFIIGTIVLIYQMSYFKKQELGFAKDAIMILPIPVIEKPVFGNGESKMRTLREELAGLAGVEAVSLNASPPSSGSVSGTNFYFEGQDESQGIDTQVKQIDGNYIDLFEIRLIAGEKIGDFDTATAFLVNEELVKAAGIDNPQEILGRKIRMWGRTLPVVGVVKNFNTVSLHQAIEPTILMNRLRAFDNLAIKVNPAQVQNVLAEVKSLWESTYPEHIFGYEFYDEQIMQSYQGEERMTVLFGLFTSMAIFIGCLGLFGLASFMANQRTKEIGVRKALGASVESIVLLFTKEYFKLIVIGFLIAAPFAWFVMNEWLAEFAYKITLGPAIFLMGFAITLTIAMLTVGYKSIRAAIVNPIKALRYE